MKNEKSEGEWWLSKSGEFAGYIINGSLELLKDSQIKLARMNRCNRKQS